LKKQFDEARLNWQNLRMRKSDPVPKVPPRFSDFAHTPHSGVQNLERFTPHKVVKSEVFPPSLQRTPPIELLSDATDHERNNSELYGRQGGEISGLGFYFMENVSVWGPGFLIKDGKRIYGPDLIPDYVEEDIANGTRLDFNPGTPKVFGGISVLLTSEAYPWYGHWLVDTLPKAWLYTCCMGEPLTNARYLFRNKTPDYGLTILAESFGVNREKMDFYSFEEEPQLELAVIPSLMHNNYVFHPAMKRAVQFILERESCRNARRSKRIYVSRKKFRGRSTSSARTILNEDELVDIAESSGFSVVYPEDLPWGEQVKLFSGAEIVVGESGSGLHNAIFSGPGAVVLCLCPASEVQGTIAALMNQRLFFQCAASENVVNGAREYLIDAGRFKRALETCIAARL
jgi:capsular polysaccharide biosynthesis protein